VGDVASELKDLLRQQIPDGWRTDGALLVLECTGQQESMLGAYLNAGGLAVERVCLVQALARHLRAQSPDFLALVANLERRLFRQDPETARLYLRERIAPLIAGPGGLLATLAGRFATLREPTVILLEKSDVLLPFVPVERFGDTLAGATVPIVVPLVRGRTLPSPRPLAQHALAATLAELHAAGQATVWLDPQGEAAQVVTDLPSLIPFRGSYLEILLALSVPAVQVYLGGHDAARALASPLGAWCATAVPVQMGYGLRPADVAVEGCPPLLGCQRLRLRVGPSESGDQSVRLVVSADALSGARVQLREAIGARIEAADCLGVPEDGSWCEVLFVVEGGREPLVEIRLHEPGGAPLAVLAVPCEESARVEPPGWQAQMDAAEARIFSHIERHGAITEAEVGQLLGSPRRMRQFARDFDDLVRHLPFRVQIETGASGKRYIRTH
jgi:hypothetical protein